jgi:hypothetical protein
MAHAALGLGGMWVNERRAPDEYARYRAQLQRAIGALGAADPKLTALLQARAAAEACYAEGASLDDVRASVELVADFDDPASTCAALSLLHHLLLAPHDQKEREAVALELQAVAARDDAPTSALMGLVWSTVDAFLAGDAEAPRLLARLRVRADELEHDAIGFLARMVELMLWLRAGRITDVENALDAVHALGVEAGEVDATPWMAGQLLSVRWLQGRQHEVLDAARSLADSADLTRFNRVYPAVWAAFAASAGAHDEARVALARVDMCGTAPGGLAPSSMWLVTMFAVVEALRHLDDAEGARQAYATLAPFGDLPLIGSLGIVCFGSAHRSLGWCALTAGDIDRAVVHFRRAIEEDIRVGNLPMLAITRADLAAVLAPSDRTAAHELLSEAVAAGARFGMTRWVEQWQAQRDLLDTTARPQAAGRWCRRDKVWEVEVGSMRVVVPNSIGMAMIAVLLAAPYSDISVEAFTGAPHTPTRQKVLDARARDELRKRLNALHQAIELADANGDAKRSLQLTEELERIRSELARMLRPGGGSRDFTTPGERSRTSVQKAIRRALDRIGEQAPEFAEKLRRSIHTGAYCRFQPTDDLPPAWITTGA